MSQLSRTFRRPSFLVPAAVVGMLVAGAIAVGVVAAGLRVETGTSETQAGAVAAAPAVRTDRAAIVSRLDSEYLREIAQGWYAPAVRTDRAAIVSRLNSEYLREIAQGW